MKLRAVFTIPRRRWGMRQWNRPRQMEPAPALAGELVPVRAVPGADFAGFPAGVYRATSADFDRYRAPEIISKPMRDRTPG
jgi:hypothetical protein